MTTNQIFTALESMGFSIMQAGTISLGITHPNCCAHPTFGLMAWNDTECQYRRVNQKDGSPSPDEFAQIQAEADRLNAGIKCPVMTEDEDAAFEEWLTRMYQ